MFHGLTQHTRTHYLQDLHINTKRVVRITWKILGFVGVCVCFIAMCNSQSIKFIYLKNTIEQIFVYLSPATITTVYMNFNTLSTNPDHLRDFQFLPLSTPKLSVFTFFLLRSTSWKWIHMIRGLLGIDSFIALWFQGFYILYHALHISLYWCTVLIYIDIFCFSTHHLMGVCIISIYWFLWTMLLQTFMYNVLCRCMTPGQLHTNIQESKVGPSCIPLCRIDRVILLRMEAWK
jgi:hypothetical protein